MSFLQRSSYSEVNETPSHASTFDAHAASSDSMSNRLWEAVQQRPWLLLAFTVYAVWFRVTAHANRTVGPWGPRWLARLVGLLQSRLMSVVGRIPLSMTPPPKGVDRERQHVVVWHPHGAYTTMAFMHCGHQNACAQPLSWFPGIAPILFNVPFFREAALLLNARSVSGSVMEKLLEAGHTVGIQPGGIPEQLQSDHTREIAVFPPRLGFVRMAMRTGAPLVPAYIFGENQAYTTYALGRWMSQLAYKYLGAPLVPITGRWGLPWLVPHPVHVAVRWGDAVDVGAPNPDPTDAQVEAVFERYVAELQRVFEAHKHTCLPPDVAARGLTIVRRSSSSRKTGAKGVRSAL